MSKVIDIGCAEEVPPLRGDWNHPAWGNAAEIFIDQFRSESSDHRPVTKAKLMYSPDALHLIYQVEDRYVRSVQTEYQSPVCTDSCVEFFVKPKLDMGYFNFELNCGGCLLCFYIEDETRKLEGGFEKYEMIPESIGAEVKIYHSMPPVVDPELISPTIWVNQLRIPLAVFEHYLGALGSLAGQAWRANFYKCGDQTSHPHWAAWSAVRDLNFHQPEDFGMLHFC